MKKDHQIFEENLYQDGGKKKEKYIYKGNEENAWGDVQKIKLMF